MDDIKNIEEIEDFSDYFWISNLLNSISEEEREALSNEKTLDKKLSETKVWSKFLINILEEFNEDFLLLYNETREEIWVELYVDISEVKRTIFLFYLIFKAKISEEDKLYKTIYEAILKTYLYFLRSNSLVNYYTNYIDSIIRDWNRGDKFRLLWFTTFLDEYSSPWITLKEANDKYNQYKEFIDFVIKEIENDEKINEIVDKTEEEIRIKTWIIWQRDIIFKYVTWVFLSKYIVNKILPNKKIVLLSKYMESLNEVSYAEIEGIIKEKIEELIEIILKLK